MRWANKRLERKCESDRSVVTGRQIGPSLWIICLSELENGVTEMWPHFSKDPCVTVCVYPHLSISHSLQDKVPKVPKLLIWCPEPGLYRSWTTSPKIHRITCKCSHARYHRVHTHKSCVHTTKDHSSSGTKNYGFNVATDRLLPNVSYSENPSGFQ